MIKTNKRSSRFPCWSEEPAFSAAEKIYDADSGFGLKDDSDEYSYQMPDELWKVAKQLINSEEN